MLFVDSPCSCICLTAVVGIGCPSQAEGAKKRLMRGIGLICLTREVE